MIILNKITNTLTKHSERQDHKFHFQCQLLRGTNSYDRSIALRLYLRKLVTGKKKINKIDIAVGRYSISYYNRDNQRMSKRKAISEKQSYREQTFTLHTHYSVTYKYQMSSVDKVRVLRLVARVLPQVHHELTRLIIVSHVRASLCIVSVTRSVYTPFADFSH